MRRLPWLVLTALLVAGCGRQATPVVSSVLPSLQLRLVVSDSYDRPCTVPPLVTAAAGAACDLAGRGTFALGPALADLRVVAARFSTEALRTDQQLDLDLDDDSASRFAEVTGASIGRRVAVLFRGRVVSSPTIQSRITGGQVQLAGAAHSLDELGRALRAAPAPRRSSAPSLDVRALAAEQEKACGAAQPRLAPGMTDQGVGLVNLSTAAGDVVRILESLGDGEGAAYWRRQPPASHVFLCNYTRLTERNAVVPSCPPGQSPIVREPTETRTFYVDARGHATELRYPLPVETCSPD